MYFTIPLLRPLFFTALCAATPALSDEMDISLTPTPWGSQIVQTAATTPIDNALPGTWRLVRVAISDAGQSIVVPVVEAQLTIGSDGRFAMDYAPARLPDGATQGSVTLELNGVAHEIVPPPDMTVPGGCPGEATFAGRVPGGLSVAYDVDLDTFAPTEADMVTEDGDIDLDVTDGIGTILGVNLRLVMSTDREAAEKPTMTCVGAQIATTVTAGPPFGFIPGPYPYALNDTHDVLVIEMPSHEGPTTTFVFVPL
ncbi:hypothetical protein [Maritimibacter sp. UBA3975]|uniref:hypothetical protein n=1 Tax=Maritimibacter sp. UBA3975 TaxID=1946833 RepID=UPI000C0B8499|nr:hypothetical protein [Maritimibacter sp. UBA3975]MAM61161.1 hypothetical protein [Maritimibacter sp.]|tara:strand:+ start:4124 stop:4888 length:765 start_codon:yes stop_codon:yes gene_type:complete